MHDDKFELTTPVALLIFNRPDETQRVFDAIRAARPKQLLIVGDTARDHKPDEAELVARTRAICQQVDWDCDVRTQYAEQNMGCRARISSGISWVFDQVEEAVILEDDCLPHASFFRFCQELLARYRHDQRVMVISGDNFQDAVHPSGYSYYFSRYNHVWGWASWRRAWQFFDVEMRAWHTVKARNLLKDILLEQPIADFWAQRFERIVAGLDTWDYQWQLACWLQNGLTILPSVNLVTNIGFAANATHTKTETRLANLPSHAMKFPLRHPPFVIRDALSDQVTDGRVYGYTIA